jgi:hypothetical protein
MPTGIYKRIKKVSGYKIKDTSNMHHTAWNKGKTVASGELKPIIRTKKWGKNISKANLGKPKFGNRGEKSYCWKGDKVGYSGIHMWVRLKLGQPTKCEMCGKIKLKGRFIQWANKDHKYKRKLSDWIRLCTSCHSKYDRKYNNYGKPKVVNTNQSKLF